MSVKGSKARALLQTLLDAVADLVPADVDVEVAGNCYLRASRIAPLDQISPENPFGGALHGEAPLFGLGPWVPFLPRKVAAKLTVQEALGMIQSSISSVARSPWPGPDYKVVVDAEQSGVRAWFDNGQQQIEVATIGYDAATS